jgi:hypothetical protein
MFILIKNYIDGLKKKGKEGLLIIFVIVGVFGACQGVQEDGNPFGPSTYTIRIIPNTVNVTQATNVTFTTLGGTAPFSWKSSNLTSGTIVAATGIFTAGAVAGTVTITVLDAVGDTATATATVLPLALGFDAGAVTQILAGGADTITVNANGSATSLTATIANNNTGSTFTALPTLATTATTIIVTATTPLPTTANQGNQTYTVSVTDNGNNNTGNFTYTLQSN